MDLQETLKMIALMLAPAFFSLLGMGALGCPAICVLGELSAKAKKRIFFDKYGQQVGAMGLILLVFLIVIYGAGVGISLNKYPHLLEQNLTPASPFFLGTALLGVFAVFGLIYLLTWKKMRNAKALHILIGAISAISAISAVAITTPAKLAFNLSQGTPSQESLAVASAIALPVSAMYAFLSLSAAAALSLAYLVLRRKKDDFGRDYYNFSLKLAARWAMLPMLGFLGCQGWLYASLTEKLQTLILGTPLAFVWAGLVAIGVIAVAIWMVIARNESPLRLKGLAFVAVFLFWAMHALNATLFVNLMTML